MNNISIEQLQSLVAEALRSGGDWCDLYFEDTRYTDLLLHDSQVSAGGTHIDYGCGIRVLKGEKTGYAYSESVDYQSLLRAVKAASSIASVEARSLNPFCASPSIQNNLYPVIRSWSETQASAFIPFLNKIEAEIRSRDKRVIKIIASLSYSSSEILMYNSLGELTRDSRPLCSVSVRAIFRQGDKTENMNASFSKRMGSEMINDELIEYIVNQTLDGLDARFEARRPKGGKMPVVMGAGASGILLHEAMGHSFEADFNRKDQSIFVDKMGKRICHPGINIVDDGTVPFARGSGNYDDEGVAGQKTYMVSDGVLTSYLHDRISAAYYGVTPTGNGRRESFRYNPIPRMRNTYMESGKDGTLEDLICSVTRGIYVDKFANGEVKIGEGDFTFYVRSGYLIESGRLTMPIKDVNIIGNGPKALADIVAVAGDSVIDPGTWTCGKEQSVAVSCGMPSVLVKSLTVGGD